MASRKKHSEGIALLSMYNDEEDDEEMEDLDDQQPSHEVDDSNGTEQDALNDDDTAMVTDEFPNKEEETDSAISNQNSTPKEGLMRPVTPQQQQQLQQGGVAKFERKRSGRRGRLAIVDYGHDEVAMSPEPEEGEFEDELQNLNGVIQEKTSPGTAQVISPSIRVTPQSTEYLEPSQASEINNTANESEAVHSEGANEVPAEGVDPMDKFLPPPPKEKCPENLQSKIDKFLALKKIGRSFNAEVRNRKDYRNPDFLLHAVRYQNIDQIGSCFSKDVFDPHGYDQSDYYLEIEADMRRERERKEQDLKRSPKVEFVSGGTQPGVVVPPTKFSMPIPVVTAGGMHSSSNAADSAPRDGRQNKKSKWDKMDGDGRNPLPSGGPDSLAAAAAVQAALLSAANVGSGYTGFAQQKRREAEERRSGERKVERRS